MDILLEAYLEGNFGDDLFVTLLAAHYRNHTFYLIDDKNRGRMIAERGELDNLLSIPEESVHRQLPGVGAYVLVGGDFYLPYGNYQKRIKRARAVKENGGSVVILGASLYKEYPEDSINDVKEFFEIADLVTFRDSTSYGQCCRLMPYVRAHLSCEMAFTLAPEYADRKAVKGEIKNLGISVRKKYGGSETDYQTYCQLIADVAALHLKTDSGNVVTFLALSTSGMDDRDAEAKIMALLPEEFHGRIHTVDYSGDIYGFIAQVDACDAMISTRFQSLCLALLLGKPFCPINYEAKVEHLLKDIGFSGRMIAYGESVLPEEVLHSVSGNSVDRKKYQAYADRAKDFFTLSDLLLNEENTAIETKEIRQFGRKVNNLLYQAIQERDLLKQNAQADLVRLLRDGQSSELLTCKTQMEGALQQISLIQRTKSYTIGLMFRRTAQQLFRKRQYKDYLKWILGIITKKNYYALPLRDFDSLEDVKKILRASLESMEEFGIYENKCFVRKDTQRVFIFASVPFYDIGGGQRSAQLARTFHSLGKQVYYIYGFPCTEENIPDMDIPVSAHKYIKEIGVGWFEKRIGKGDLAVFEFPYGEFEAYLDLAKKKGAYTVYEHIDNWDSSLGCLFYQEDTFNRYLEKADLITVTARMLGEKIEQKSDRNWLYLPNAVNAEIFEPGKTYRKPSDLVIGKDKTLLYFGSLWGEWFDWEKIDFVAAHCPGCEINLIGDNSGCRDRVKNARKNIHFLGIKKQTDLPAYLAYTDVALLPFKNSEIGKYVSPLKIFEYIAMRVLVLATPLDDIQNYPNVICSDTEEGWVEALKKDMPVVDSSVFISNNNWFARCQTILERAESVRKEYPAVSVIVLNHNNRNVIGRCVDSLLAHRTYAGYEVIVVDNQSTDGSYEMLADQYGDRIVLVKNDKNGCSTGRNMGVKHAKGEYICFLDSDQWVVSDLWLENGLHILEQDREIGAAGWAAGWFQPNCVFGPIGDSYVFRGIYRPQYAYRKDIAYLGSGGLIMKRSLFQEIGGFDEFYDPTCFEDTDLSLSIRHAGYELAYCPNMPIMHLPHQTTSAGSPAHAALMKKNGQYFQEKWMRLQPDLLEYYLDETTV